MQAKLDELIRAVARARSQFIGIEHMADHQIEAIRAALEQEAEAAADTLKTAHESVERLLRRY
jgi:low affinity Fe/Cu permease